ncbi:MAG: RNA polymerase sigma factor [Cyclobacteriaceae bacterium]|nr:RNA polymerase sigma factor [Cyclobacteriaceae bacterium]
MGSSNAFKVIYSKSREQDIWQDFQAGDKDAFNKIYDVYAEILMNYAYKFTFDTLVIEDSVQELFIDLWEHRSKISVPDSVKAYLLKSLRNKIIQKLQKQSRQNSLLNHLKDSKQFLPFSFSIETELIKNETEKSTIDKVEQLLANLSDLQREVIYHKFYNDLSQAEISQIMNLPRKTIYNAMAKGLLKMKALLIEKMAMISLFCCFCLG